MIAVVVIATPIFTLIAIDAAGPQDPRIYVYNDASSDARIRIVVDGEPYCAAMTVTARDHGLCPQFGDLHLKVDGKASHTIELVGALQDGTPIEKHGNFSKAYIELHVDSFGNVALGES